MQVKHDIIVDFARPSRSSTIICSEGDVDSRLCHFILLNNKSPFSMGDVVSATVQGTKRDKKSSYGVAEFVYDEAGNKINELEYVLPSVLTDTAGDVAMQIDLMSSAGERVKSFSFYIKVQNALFNEDDMISDSDFSGFRDLLNRCTATLEKMEAMTEADALPNPYALDIEIEGEHTVYTGSEAKEISLNNMAYIDESEDVIIEDALDESAASRAAASAQAASNSKDAVELLVNQAGDLADTMGGYRNETLGYKNDAENSRFQSIQASLLAEGYKNDADLSRSQSVQASLLAEGYSVGTQNGEEVTEGSPYYHNNAKWFKENSVDVKVSGLSNKGRSLAKVTIDGRDNYIRLGEVDASEIAFGDGTVSSELNEINNYDQILAGQISSVEGRVEALEEGGGTSVVANPTLSGSEADLTALEVDGTKYKIASGSGNADKVELTKAEYDALPESKLTDGKMYFVTDWNESTSAKNVGYNNSTTQIEATNVQDAIDSVFHSVSNGKELVASAISDKGIPTLATDTFKTMADNIVKISTKITDTGFVHTFTGSGLGISNFNTLDCPLLNDFDFAFTLTSVSGFEGFSLPFKIKKKDTEETYKISCNVIHTSARTSQTQYINYWGLAESSSTAVNINITDENARFPNANIEGTPFINVVVPSGEGFYESNLIFSLGGTHTGSGNWNITNLKIEKVV